VCGRDRMDARRCVEAQVSRVLGQWAPEAQRPPKRNA
jgi:hypothetical protein